MEKVLTTEKYGNIIQIVSENLRTSIKQQPDRKNYEREVRYMLNFGCYSNLIAGNTTCEITSACI